MTHPARRSLGEAVQQGLGWFRRPEVLVFLPAITLAAFWLGGERALLGVALIAPMMFLLAGAAPSRDAMLQAVLPDALTGLALRPQAIARLDDILRDSHVTGLETACLVVQFDEIDTLLDRHGRAAQTEVLARAAERLCAALRNGDMVARLEGGGLAVVLAPQRRLTLESMVQLAARLQAAMAAPIALHAARIYVTISVGFCLGSESPARTGRALLDAGQIAADEASRHGPGAIRAYAPDLPTRRADRDARRAELETALDEGQIYPHFQPQLCTDTGQISGFEALARWHHPDRGLLPPADFLPAMEEAGLIERLGEVMLFHALTALVRWDKAQLHVPTVGVNFSATELRNPLLIDKLKWELDRFDLAPQRLSVEILESVAAETANDMVVQNIAGLSALGCGVDLDDFGTGHASITNIRRFAVRRLKIDRSFVRRIDSDREQQRMVMAILAMAEKFDLDTVAEGVETPAEHAMLAQLGCRHVQGFGIGRPMSFDQASQWITQHQSRQYCPLSLGRTLG